MKVNNQFSEISHISFHPLRVACPWGTVVERLIYFFSDHHQKLI